MKKLPWKTRKTPLLDLNIYKWLFVKNRIIQHLTTSSFQTNALPASTQHYQSLDKKKTRDHKRSFPNFLPVRWCGTLSKWGFYLTCKAIINYENVTQCDFVRNALFRCGWVLHKDGLIYCTSRSYNWFSSKQIDVSQCPSN